jgi:hypothetical protein
MQKSNSFFRALLKVFCFSFVLATLFFIVSMAKPPTEAHAASFADLWIRVQDSSGNRINGASVSLTMGPLLAGNFCNSPGIFGTTLSGTTVNNALFGDGMVELGSGNLCCNVQSATVTVSKFGYDTASNVSVLSSLANGSTGIATITLTPSAPSVSISVSPTTIAWNATTAVTWSASPATACSINYQIGAGPIVSGWRTGISGTNQTSPALNANTVFSAICSNSGTAGGGSVTVTVNPQPPTVTISASPNPIFSGATTGVTWSASPATACSINYQIGAGPIVSGWRTGISGTNQTSPALNANTVFSAICSNSGTAGGASTTVTVNPLPNNTLNVNSSGVVGVVMTGTYPGTTNYVQTSTSSLSGTITAPDASGGKNFFSWTGCDSTISHDCTVSVSAGGTKTVTATYVSCANASPGIANQLTGCVYGSNNWTGKSENASSGTVQTSPVADTGDAINYNPITTDVNNYISNGGVFSTRWWGQFTFKAGVYRFLLDPDDTGTLYINGVSVVTSGCCAGTAANFSISTAGSYNVQLDQVNTIGNGRIHLTWTYTPFPADPSTLAATASCVGQVPQISFSFVDNSTTEDEFIIDVNSAPWTGDNAPSPWGFKTLATANKVGIGGTQTFVWSSAAPLTGGPPTAPANSSNYYWRVIAHDLTSGGFSAHIYPSLTPLTPPGTAITTQNCVPQPRPHGCQADFNGDGTIDAADQTIYNAATPGATTLNGGTVSPIFDLNDDGKKDTIDSLILAKMVPFNFSTCLPVPPVPVAPDCPSSNFGPALNFPWLWSGTGVLSYDIRLSDTATYVTFATKNVPGAGLSTTGTGGWSGPFTSLGNLSLAPSTAYFWSVKVNTTDGSSPYSPNAKILASTCTVPANPSGLSVTSACSGANPQVTFTFLDNSTNEDSFFLDVNSLAWTGDAAPSPWGVKTINRTAGQKTSFGTVNYIWSSTTPLDSGTPLTPGNGVTYYWRVSAHSVTRGDSAHVYPPSTTVVPGTSFTSNACVPPVVPTTPTLGNLPSCLFTGGYGPGLTFTWGNPSSGYKIEVSDTANTAGVYSGANVAVKTVLTGGASSTTGVGGWTGPLGIVGLNNLDLQIGQFYWWHVQNINSLGSSTFADGGSFIVPQCAPPDPTNLQAHYPSCSDTAYGDISTSGILDGQIDAPRSDMIRFTWDGALAAQSPYHEVYVIEGDVTFSAVNFNKGTIGPVPYANIYIPNPNVTSEIKDGTPTWSATAGSWGGSGFVIVNAGSLALQPETTYSWFVQARASLSGSSLVSNWVKGGTIKSLDCPYHNLHVETYDDPATFSEFYDDTTCTPANAHPAGATFASGANLCTKVRITNISPALYAQVADAATLIGIWPAGVPAPPGPFVCSGPPYGPFSSSLNSLLTAPLGPLPTTQSATAGSSFSTTLGTGFLVVGGVTTATTVASTGSLAAGATAEIIVHFTVPNWKGTFTAPVIVDPGCTNSREAAQTKNVLASWSDNTESLNYQVNVNGFFDTNFGDAGSGGGAAGAITVTQAPPATPVAVQISDYLVAASGTLGATITAPWKISGYGSRLQMPTTAGAYDYMNKKFRAAAGTSCPAAGFANGVNVCTGNITIDSATSSYSTFPSATAVVFIDGNLTINSNYTGSTPTSANSVVFIVSGSVNVRGGSSPVTAIDGIYIVGGASGGAFNSGDGLGTLTVNGGVYANSVALTRTSTTPTTAAGEVFNVQIKNLLLFNSLIGSNSTVWQEVTP